MNSKTLFFIALLAMVWGFIYFGAKVLVPIIPKSESEIRMERGCSLVSQHYTGGKRYCGKACWRKEIRTEYLCKDNGEVLVYIQ